MKITTVAVVGVTGTMGANVAGIFASFGDAKVYCVGRDIEKVKKTIPRIVNSVKAEAIAKNLVPADFSILNSCVADSDLVFESSSEKIEVKKSIAEQVGRSLQPHAASCTGTSASCAFWKTDQSNSSPGPGSSSRHPYRSTFRSFSPSS